MSIEKAKSLFHGVDKLNCAQAILKAFQAKFNISEEMIAEYKKNGGGRAEGGICGALYSVQQLMPEQSVKATEMFNSKAGFATCREIKTVSKYPCSDCVVLAAEIVEQLQN